jgi:hypothetical protein
MLLFAKYTLCFWMLYFIFWGAGELTRLSLRVKDSSVLFGKRIETILLGIGFVHFSSSLLQLYFSHTSSSVIYLLLLSVLFIIGIYLGVIKDKAKLDFGKISFLHLILFLFLLLPFRGFDSEFLASEESGDHTIYLGPVKAQYVQKDTEITNPKWNLALTRAVYDSRIGVIIPALERIFPMYEAARKAKWEIDPIDRVILEGFSPAWWALHWGLTGFGYYLPILPETIYLSTLFFLTSLICLQILFISYLLLKNHRQYKVILVFLGFLITLSACIGKITYGNFYLQLIALNSLLWIFQASISWIKTRNRDAFYLACLFSFIIGPSFYFMGTVYWGLIFVSFLLVFYKSKLLGGLFRFISKPVILIGILFYLPIVLVNIGSFLKFLPSNSSSIQNKQYWDQVLGGTVTGAGAFLNPILGVVTYFQFYPKLPFKEQVDSLTFLLTPFGLGIFLIFFWGILKSVFWESRKYFKLNLFLLFVLSGILFINLKSITHYYNYNKASQYTFPFLIILFPFYFLKLKANFKSMYLVWFVLFVWIIFLIPAKFRQIESFTSLREKSLSSFLLLPERLENPIEKTIFFFGESRNHALLETYMAGNRVIPVGNYPIGSFKKYFNFQNINSNRFMLKNKNSDSYTLFEVSRFFIANEESWIALSSFIDLNSSEIPKITRLIAMEKLEVFADLKKTKTLRITSPDSSLAPSVNREKYISDRNTYLPAEEIQFASKVCSRGECQYTYLLEPSGKNYFVIERALQVEVF